MKVRFYCDVPEYANPDMPLCAWQKTYGQPMHGNKRIAFDVDFPDDVMKRADGAAPAKFIGEVADLNEEQTP